MTHSSISWNIKEKHTGIDTRDWLNRRTRGGRESDTRDWLNRRTRGGRERDTRDWLNRRTRGGRERETDTRD